MLLRELHPEIKNIPIKIYIDNKYLYDAFQSHKYVSDKCLRTDIGAFRKLLQKHKIHQICWVKKQHQLAVLLTKIEENILVIINTFTSGILIDSE